MTKPSTVAHGVRHVEVSADAGQRIDNYLIRTLAGVPRSRVYRMLRAGEVRVNRQRVRPDYRLKAGDRVRVPPWHADIRAPDQVPRSALERIASQVIHEDERLIVVDKPAGLAVHGGSGVAFGMIEALRAIYPRGGRLELAHRIDRDTSGLVLVARGRAALVELHDAFRERRVAKSYAVLVYGRWQRKLRNVQSPLTRYVTAGGERRVRVDADSGKPARTDFEVVAATEAVSWLTAVPQTGRTHQIRVHCRQAQHAIVGDEKYASDVELDRARAAGIKRLCLHAATIGVVLDGRKWKFESPIPAAFTDAWRALGGGADPTR